MMQIGKAVRMERLFNRDTKRCIIVPMDHGVSDGPVPGLVDIRDAVQDVAEGGADAVLMHKGIVRCAHRSYGKDVGLIVHLSASTSLAPTPNGKVLVGTVEDAVRLGADGVSVHVNLGDPNESRMLEDLGRIASSAQNWGMPLLAMMYARGPQIKNSLDPVVLAHCARVAAELGADIIKVNYTGDVESFVKVASCCCIPIVIAGGPKTNTTREFIQMVHDAIQAGAAGLSVGRNIFQHTRRTQLVSALAGVVHSGWSVDKAVALVGEE